jgi:hypothetical protein
MRARDGLAELEHELVAEKANALGRIAGHLDALLAVLRSIETEFVTAPPSDRPLLRTRHRLVRAEATKYRWYLIVQREVLGLYDRGEVDRYYPDPGPL